MLIAACYFFKKCVIFPTHLVARPGVRLVVVAQEMSHTLCFFGLNYYNILYPAKVISVGDSTITIIMLGVLPTGIV